MKNYSILPILTLFIFVGCTTSPTLPPQPEPPKTTPYQEPTAQKSDAFQGAIGKVARSIKDDVTYTKMNLDTPEKKEWFKRLMYQLWDRQITREAFINIGLEKYPTHQYEFLFVANGFQKGS